MPKYLPGRKTTCSWCRESPVDPQHHVCDQNRVVDVAVKFFDTTGCFPAPEVLAYLNVTEENFVAVCGRKQLQFKKIAHVTRLRVHGSCIQHAAIYKKEFTLTKTFFQDGTAFVDQVDIVYSKHDFLGQPLPIRSTDVSTLSALDKFVTEKYNLSDPGTTTMVGEIKITLEDGTTIDATGGITAS